MAVQVYEVVGRLLRSKIEAWALQVHTQKATQ